jgi:translation initiation factor 5A
VVAKVIDATEMRVGTFLLMEGETYQVKKTDISKTGKHGHAKVRFEAVNIITGKKKVLVVPGHDKFEVPMINKKKAQVLSISGNKVSIMDSESFENFEIDKPENVEGINEGSEVEYWEVEGDKILKKSL